MFHENAVASGSGTTAETYVQKNNIDSVAKDDQNAVGTPMHQHLPIMEPKLVPCWKNIFFLLETLIATTLSILVVVHLFKSDSLDVAFPCNSRIATQFFMVGTLGLVISLYQGIVFVQYGEKDRLPMATFPYLHIFPIIVICGHLATTIGHVDTICFYTNSYTLQWMVYFYSPIVIVILLGLCGTVAFLVRSIFSR